MTARVPMTAPEAEQPDPVAPPPNSQRIDIGRFTIAVGRWAESCLAAVPSPLRDSVRSLVALPAALNVRRRPVSGIARDLVQRVATTPVVNWVVDAQVERAVWPIVPRVVDDVLLLLSTEPDRVRVLIREQRTSLTDEMLDHVRVSAAAGDAAIDRAVMRLLGRRPATKAPRAATTSTGALPPAADS
jgi:hypothetical protein